MCRAGCCKGKRNRAVCRVILFAPVGAFRPEVRTLVLLVAIVSKVAFIGLVVAYGFTGSSAGMAIWLDAAFVILFGLLLLNGMRGSVQSSD